MNEIEPITHFLALGAIILVAGFFAALFAGAALYKHTVERMDEEDPEYEPGEIDATYYPDDEDSVIFRQ